MPSQTSSRYLVCTKNRGLQRKHIDVCKRCACNDGCREFQEYLRMEPVVAESMVSTQKPVAISMVDLIEQLSEIRQLVGNGTSGYQLNRHKDGRCNPAPSLNRLLRDELKAIKSICQSDLVDSSTSPTGPWK